ncbi:phosphomevalonate kinase [Corynebacterium uberis]|uniref:phosphomevalonate kinase n=1 Tax=Corynebacterium TaxID=1716 RepID=UPI001D0A61FE|nr:MULTISPECIES: phosphomevalonate kinase [Corynebacterium]MCZ9308864.1 phosphomevalonate kinase [Corynebacterium sp. c6VSa_13]UDL74657.1 phosphomevalonate kinase [Corynebacterium uberis]UDL76509.1 phosphomevalonate kinase [Corynebacterium uberis]UDL78721.1 phosphomevalonate kinase [Corynebacterium uberis]UDL81000.1 phosphomevalonate kinase [Corynebacterium uberis]
MIEVHAPGKLYIAGEYAVVETGFPALLIAVDRYLTVRVSPAQDMGHITSDHNSGSSLAWYRRAASMVVDADGTTFDFVLAAIRVVEEIAAAVGRPLEVYDLDITSELGDDSGRKFGLGSSAAVTVATVQALCAYYRLDLQPMEQLKAALLASTLVQRSGSGGDVAASMFGGWVCYTSFDREWVEQQRNLVALAELVRQDWPGLSVRRVTPPEGLRLLVGWTGSPASTARLVGDVQARRTGVTSYVDFLAGSRRCVTDIVAALDAGDSAAVLEGIRRNRELLRDLGELTGTTIETPLLTRLIETAQEHGAASKSSGAGGGDCGIALIDAAGDTDGLIAAWERADIRLLNLHEHRPRAL